MRSWAVFSPSRLRLYSWLSLISEILIVVTGGAVRLTGSGLGCPTWPKCTEDSFVNVPEMGIHGVIEFANRTLTGVLAIIALLTIVAAWRQKTNRKIYLAPALALLALIVLQAVVGGITVLTGLNPWVVGLHFVISGVMITIASLLLWRAYAPRHQPIPQLTYRLAWPIVLVGWISVLVGILVTGAGPHSGDAETGRNGLDLEIWQHFHSYPAYLLLVLIALAFGNLLKLDRGQAFKNWRTQTKIYLLLLVVTLFQAFIGVLQSRLGVPPLLVGIHMLGASVLISLFTFQWLSVRGKVRAS
jgi:cytochrome c oxidase assembly protein subunit 15